MLSANCKQVVLLLLLNNLVYGQNDQCVYTIDKRAGVCMPLKQCAVAVKVLNSGAIPQTCRFDDGYPIVCCPLDVDNRITDNVSDKKCDEYAEKLKFVQKKGVQINIVGGVNASDAEFPHMAALGYGEPGDIKWKCGGSLISERFVLTAAHCIKSGEDGDVKYVQLGALKLNGPSTTRQNYLVIEKIIHSEYNAPLVYNDIALLKLDKDVTFTPHVKPACIYTTQEFNGKYTYEATGWGFTEFGGSNSEILQKVDLDVFHDCEKTVPLSTRKLNKGILPESQLCFGSVKESKDTCSGDSGGPLQIYYYNKLLHCIVGVTSAGSGCGTPNSPGIYTRVSHFVPWIEKIVWK